MYNEFINNKVVILVSARTEGLWEYSGLLVEVDEKFLKLKNVTISQAMLNMQRNMFGSAVGAYKQNIEEIVLNKDYIVSCHKNNLL